MKHKEQFYNMMDDFAKALYLEEILYDELGAEEFLASLIRALPIDDLIDNYEYIARTQDIEIFEED